MDKNMKCVRQHGLMQDSEGDTLSGSTDTSRWSSPTLCCGGDGPQDDSSDCEVKTDRTPDVQPSVMWQRQRQTGAKKGNKLQGKQKKNHQVLKLPPIRPLPSVQPAGMTCIMELKSQLRDLQLQLTEARTENKVLKRVQHRHMVALQHFQESEDSILQIRAKHNSEVKALQAVLHQTRSSRDTLGRQLQATENKLLNTRAALQHLQLLHQDHSLLQREELTLKLAKASAELQDKDKKTQDLKRSLELHQASFERQLAAEQRKVKEGRKISSCLRMDICQLTAEVQCRERKLEKHNIYYNMYLKGPSKKGRKNKMVQTTEALFSPKCPIDFLETKSCESEKLQDGSVDWCCSKQVQETLVTEKPEGKDSDVLLEENLQEETNIDHSVFFAKHSRQNSYVEESPDGSPGHPTEDGCTSQSEAAETQQELEEQETDSESRLSPDEDKPQRNKDKLPKFRRKYLFTKSVENLHDGRPVDSRAETLPAQKPCDVGDPLGLSNRTSANEESDLSAVVISE